MTDTEYLKILKQRIRTARLAANFSQDQMAELLGIGVRRYQRMESSTIVDFKVSTLLRVARVANVSMTDLMADISNAELESLARDSKAKRVSKNQSKA
jgi:transcriptional regulator with XRE-family HTH domain